ncbi:hypothetical protein ACEPPN_013066 [Leptodophora sp. 'Broadleaf-Isolate-01']
MAEILLAETSLCEVNPSVAEKLLTDCTLWLSEAISSDETDKLDTLLKLWLKLSLSLKVRETGTETVLIDPDQLSKLELADQEKLPVELSCGSQNTITVAVPVPADTLGLTEEPRFGVVVPMPRRVAGGDVAG